MDIDAIDEDIHLQNDTYTNINERCSKNDADDNENNQSHDYSQDKDDVEITEFNREQRHIDEVNKILNIWVEKFELPSVSNLLESPSEKCMKNSTQTRKTEQRAQKQHHLRAIETEYSKERLSNLNTFDNKVHSGTVLNDYSFKRTSIIRLLCNNINNACFGEQNEDANLKEWKKSLPTLSTHVGGHNTLYDCITHIVLFTNFCNCVHMCESYSQSEANTFWFNYPDSNLAKICESQKMGALVCHGDFKRTILVPYSELFAYMRKYNPPNEALEAKLNKSMLKPILSVRLLCMIRNENSRKTNRAFIMTLFTGIILAVFAYMFNAYCTSSQ